MAVPCRLQGSGSHSTNFDPELWSSTYSCFDCPSGNFIIWIWFWKCMLCNKTIYFPDEVVCLFARPAHSLYDLVQIQHGAPSAQHPGKAPRHRAAIYWVTRRLHFHPAACTFVISASARVEKCCLFNINNILDWLWRWLLLMLIYVNINENCMYFRLNMQLKATVPGALMEIQAP